jgi:hypothetical protein
MTKVTYTNKGILKKIGIEWWRQCAQKEWKGLELNNESDLDK